MTATDAWATFRENAPQIVAGLIVVVFSMCIFVLWVTSRDFKWRFNNHAP